MNVTDVIVVARDWRGRTGAITSALGLKQIWIVALDCGAKGRAVAQHWLARISRRAPAWLLASAMAALGAPSTFPAPPHKHAPAVEAQRHTRGSAPVAKRSVTAQDRNPASHEIGRAHV